MMGKKISPDMRREIEALSREGLPQKEIAARTNVCIDTCRMVEKDLGLQRQPAKRTHGPCGPSAPLARRKNVVDAPPWIHATGNRAPTQAQPPPHVPVFPP